MRIVENVDPLAFQFATTRFPLSDTIQGSAPVLLISQGIVLTSGLDPAEDSGVTGDAITNFVRPSIVGTATPGALVTVTSPTGEMMTVTASQDGNWSVRPNIPSPDGMARLRSRPSTSTATPYKTLFQSPSTPWPPPPSR